MLPGYETYRTVRRGFRFVRNAIWPSLRVTEAPANIHVEWDIPVKVRDGTVLRINVFRPQGPGPFPVILSAHPYGKDKIPAKTRSGRGVPFAVPHVAPAAASAHLRLHQLGGA